MSGCIVADLGGTARHPIAMCGVVVEVIAPVYCAMTNPLQSVGVSGRVAAYEEVVNDLLEPQRLG